MVLFVLVTGCQTVGGPVAGGPDPTPSTVVVEAGTISEAGEEAAQALLDSARGSFEARRYFEVLRTTEEVLGRYPQSRASGEALRLTALAHFEVGQMTEADAAAERYLDLLPAGDPRGAELRLVQARAAEALQAEPRARLEPLLRIGPDADPSVLAEAGGLVRTLADSLDVTELEAAVRGVPPDGPLIPLVRARMAVSLLEEGREAEARLEARRALDGGATGTEAAWAEGVLEGELPPERRRVTTFTIGAVLPTTGPPALAEYAEGIRDGIELAVATVLGEEFTVSALVRDDEGDPQLGAEIVRELQESDSVVAIVGLLLDDVLRSAGMARTVPIPMMSPTARSAQEAGEAVYSLEGADPAAARSIAEYAARRAFQRIAMLYPNNPAARAEADAFEARARALGMPVVGRFEYEPGATFFEPQILGARDALRAAELDSLQLAEDDTLHMEVLEPAALFMPIPPEDVEFLAPQVIHFGLDTLAIEVLGTSGWTDPGTLAEVDTRLTTGVVATAPVGTEATAEGPRRFRQAYEQYFQRSVVSTAPAVGYDATLLLLEGLRQGRVDPQRLQAELEDLEAVQGATGVLSIRDGRVVRLVDVVRIEERALVPVEDPLYVPPPTPSGRDQER